MTLHPISDAISRGDPTGTTVVRRRFEGDITRRFRKIKGLINKSIVANNALGIGNRIVSDEAIVHIFRDQALEPNAFQFSRSADKVGGFMAWLSSQQDEHILEILPGTPMQQAAETAWTNTYIESAYVKGIRDAGGELRKAGADVAPSWVEQALTRPLHADRVGIAFTRTFSQLRGITQAMDQQISRILAEGLAAGQNPAVIARQINNRIDKIGITRARVLARTEVISAHAQATLNGYEEAGIEGVETRAEFATAGDGDVCPECEALEGKVYSIQESRGVIPVHPNCRCAWIPVVEGGTDIELR